jgi:hypothetical protein
VKNLMKGSFAVATLLPRGRHLKRTSRPGERTLLFHSFPRTQPVNIFVATDSSLVATGGTARPTPAVHSLP